jgi:hypothetical protein
MYEQKDGKGWFMKDSVDLCLVKQYAKISDASFGCENCGLGLHMVLDLEDGGGVCWSFYTLDEIRDFMKELNVDNLNSIVGKVVETWWKEKIAWGTSILGITINKNLV